MPTTEELAIKLEGVDSRGRSNTHRIDKMEERQDNMEQLVSSVALLATEQEHIKGDVTEIKADVKTLAEKPGKRWDALVGVIISALAAGMVGFILGQIGL